MYDTTFWGTRRLTSLHQKCDAKQPCRRCVNGNRGAECAYELRRTPRPTVTLQTSTEVASGPPLTPLLPPWPDSSEPTSPQSPASCERPPTPTARLLWEPSPRTHNEIVSSDVSVVREIRGTTERVSRLTGSFFEILPSTHFQTIPRSLRAPSYSFPPERVQVSLTTGSDLDVTLCVFCRLQNVHRVAWTKP